MFLITILNVGFVFFSKIKSNSLNTSARTQNSASAKALKQAGSLSYASYCILSGIMNQFLRHYCQDKHGCFQTAVMEGGTSQVLLLYEDSFLQMEVKPAGNDDA